MTEGETILAVIFGVGLAVYSLIAIVPLVLGFGILIPGGEIAFPLLIAWCVLNWRRINR